MKIDISKAYDRVSWAFLQDVMAEMGFATDWIERIMLCVSIVSYTVLINGEEVGPIIPRRGLRQGDPLSPYLFILCAEGLSSLITATECHGEVHGCRVCRGGPSISHLLFADDNFLFFKASVDECSFIKTILNNYEMVGSGQAINYQESGVFFSHNVNASVKHSIT